MRIIIIGSWKIIKFNNGDNRNITISTSNFEIRDQYRIREIRRVNVFMRVKMAIRNIEEKISAWRIGEQMNPCRERSFDVGARSSSWNMVITGSRLSSHGPASRGQALETRWRLDPWYMGPLVCQIDDNIFK